MNLQYLRYALEVSRTGSISKAAENLSVAQPNLSRAIKELESSLGIAIFDRTRTGMTVTPEGEKLLSSGERILREVEELETMFDGEEAPRETLTVAAAHADYVAHAIAHLCRDLPTDGRYDILCREVDLAEAIGEVARGECRLGIIRFPVHFERYYADRLAAQELHMETLAEFSPVILASRKSRLSELDTVRDSDLAGLCELTAPDVPLNESSAVIPPRRLHITERAARRELLATDPATYERTLPLPPDMAERLGLVVRPLAAPEAALRDVLIYPAHYRLTPLDRRFVEVVREATKACH